jgi:hypothetical protein
VFLEDRSLSILATIAPGYFGFCIGRLCEMICPNCGHRFFVSKQYGGLNPFSDECGNCGAKSS